MFVSLGTYAKPENRTRAFTLVRLAVNMGFMAGPALGGLIILGIGYKGLFWSDGASCIISILIFMLLVKEKKKVVADTHVITEDVTQRSVTNDKLFLLFLFCSFAAAMVFFQLFTTLPLYHKEQYGMSEFQTGLLMSFNGLLVLLCEMPIVGFVERKSIQKIKAIALGAFLMGISFFSLLFEGWMGILVVSMVIISYAEMLNFPFSNSFAMNRAPRGREGQYMAAYTMTFSLAHIVSGKTGLEIIARWGYAANWVFMGCVGLLATTVLLYLNTRLLKENT
jgi:predicted MFS family arabinose efflux permease